MNNLGNIDTDKERDKDADRYYENYNKEFDSQEDDEKQRNQMYSDWEMGLSKKK